MNWSYIGLGVPFFIIGIIEIIYKWTPRKKSRLQKLSKKYNKDIDSKKYCQLEGACDCFVGLIAVAIGCLGLNDNDSLIIYLICMLYLQLIYSKLRNSFLNLR